MPRFETWNELLLHHWDGSTHPAVIDDDGEVTGEELLGLAAGAAQWFDECGFAAGMPVPALMDESRTSIAMLVGGALSRRPLAPLGTKLAVDELAVALRNLGSRHLFVDPSRIELAEQIAALTGVELVVVERGPEPAVPLAGACRPDDVAAIVHTSGTTGRPKPIHLVQRQLEARVHTYQVAMGIGPGDRYCSASPFYHTAGVTMDVTVLAMGVALIPQDWFSIENWRRAGRLGATCVLLVPTMIDMLLAAGALGEVSPRVLQYGAMPIHPDTLRAALATLPHTRLVQIFGQTEVSPIAYLSHEDHLRAAADRPDLLLSVGKAVEGTELRVEQPDDEGIGEIAVLAPHAFQIDADGWRRSGDLGRISDEGYLSLHGRVNDRIIRGGENIYPLEIELVLQEHPKVREAAVVGVADRRWGEIVKAVVVPVDPVDPPDQAELVALTASRLAHFKIPAIIEVIDELPRNPSGKILRRLLR